MTQEEAIKIIKECKEKGFKHTFYTVNEYDTALDMAIKALEQEPCEDCISRQAVLDLIADYDLSMGQVVKGVHALPPAQPEIIRCKDCKHYQFADNRAFGMPVKMCEWFGFEDVDADDFCSRAERRTGMALSAQNVPSVTPQPKYEDIAKAFQFGLAIGFGKKYDEMDRVIDEIKKVICKGEQD